jgi:hypothetical protein
MNHRSWSRFGHLASWSLMCGVAVSGWSQQNIVAARTDCAASFTLINPLSNVPTRYRAVRAIDDRGTRQHWLLLKDQSHPACPALLVQAPRYRSCAGLGQTEIDSRSHSVPEFSLPVIHVGDPIVVSEHTPTLDAELEATALEAAIAGEPLGVRLKIGGQTLRAIADAPGRATRIAKASERPR